MNDFTEQSALAAMQAMLTNSKSYSAEQLEWVVQQSFKIAKMMNDERNKISQETYNEYTSPRR